MYTLNRHPCLHLPRRSALLAALAATFCLATAGCTLKSAEDDPPGEPPVVEVEHRGAGSLFRVAHPEQFPLVAASSHADAPELKVTGLVTADVSRNVPVISLATGRILEIRARLGDTVAKGQLLMRVQSADIADAFSTYEQAVADEKLADSQLSRSKMIYEKGALAKKDLEVAQNAEEKADVAVKAAEQHLRVLGVDKNNPTAIVEITAPVAGVITDQQVTAASGTQGLASPNAFTISDLSHVWVLCDVYENDLSFVHLGQVAEIRLNAYPGTVLKGRLSNIGSILDPNIRTAKVRIEIENPGMIRIGMFVEATFHGEQTLVRALLPSSAVLHLHDRDWVYVPQGGNIFRRVEVRSGKMLDQSLQEILTGVRPGQKVVADALTLQTETGY